MSADVILSVGNRFTDWSASSWRRGVTFSIPPTSLIQCDIDPREIGKNYPVAVGLVGDARATLTDLLAALGPDSGVAHCRELAVRSGDRPPPASLVRARRSDVRLDCPADDDGPCRSRGPAGDCRRRHRRDRRRPSPRDGEAALGDPPAAHPHHVRRLLDDGLHPAGRDRRPAGQARSRGPCDLW